MEITIEHYLALAAWIAVIIFSLSNIYIKFSFGVITLGSDKFVKNKETATFAYQFPLWKPFITFEINKDK